MPIFFRTCKIMAIDHVKMEYDAMCCLFFCHLGKQICVVFFSYGLYLSGCKNDFCL